MGIYPKPETLKPIAYYVVMLAWVRDEDTLVNLRPQGIIALNPKA